MLVDALKLHTNWHCTSHISSTCMCSLDGLMCARLFVKGAAEMVLDLCTQQVLLVYIKIKSLLM